jgi:A/G-specific adenine glycosylase
MLQQTQVKTVRERFYFPFLNKFPTLKSLAESPQQDVLKAWQGLGYYNRAANLHKSARLCKGRLPRTIDGLIALPGIGRNTAHAVAAFAYRQPVAVMEANLRRVLSRIFALENPSEAELWEKAQTLLDKRDPFDYNQAMMDIGSDVCTKRAPDCPVCPANSMCLGQASPESYPAPKQKKSVPIRKKNILVRRNRKGEFYATPRQGKFLNGLYHFVEIDGSLPPSKGQHLGAVRQQYSHFTLEAEIYLEPANSSGRDWHSLAQLKKLPMSMAEQKVLKLLSS